MSAQTQWSGTTTASPALMLFVSALLLGFISSLSDDGSWRMALVIAGLILILMATFFFARVLVTPAGVEVLLGPFGHPRLFRRLDDIEAARPIRVHPLRYGGWGYRLVFGGPAVIVRGGNALELRLKGGRRFLVTLNEADEAAQCINQLIEDDRPRSHIV